MISFFPSPYPDELWYSVICRYHVHSGNSCAKHTMRQLGFLLLVLAADTQDSFWKMDLADD